MTRYKFCLAVFYVMRPNDMSGWFRWDDDKIKNDGFQVSFTVDRTGAVYGSNSNRSLGAERKRYRGTFW
eukprot:SAG31_NODE_22392_length_526_cov_1.779859_1_plen_68_part_10